MERTPRKVLQVLERAWSIAMPPAPTGWSALRIRARNALALSLYAGACACTQAPAPEPRGGVVSNPTEVTAAAPPSLPAPARAPWPDVSGPGTPCANLADIGEFPDLYGTPMRDAEYLALKQAGRAAIPCLVAEVASTQPMAVPQTSPSGAPFTVGDMAFLLLVDFGYVDFLQALPPDVQAVAQTRGAFAYFDWIAAPGNRERLRERVHAQVERAGTVATATP
jgi:hypothetical protein